MVFCYKRQIDLPLYPRRVSCRIFVLSHPRLSLIRSFHRFGSTKWDGKPLCNGYFGRIGNREFEIDREVSYGDLPAIKGSSAEDASDVELEADGPSTPRVLASTSKPTTPSVAQATPSKPSTVPAQSFYAHVKPKPKPTGPL